MTISDDTKSKALENLAAHRRMRETEDERWERTIGAALATGNTVADVAHAAGLPVGDVERIAARLRL